MRGRFKGGVARQLRRDLGITPAELAVKIGRSVESVRFYEIGRVQPPTDVGKKIARVLRCRLDELYEDAPTVRDVVRAILAERDAQGLPNKLTDDQVIDAVAILTTGRPL
jgi:DNA-binding XRE family transcriptional regulator